MGNNQIKYHPAPARTTIDNQQKQPTIPNPPTKPTTDNVPITPAITKSNTPPPPKINKECKHFIPIQNVKPIQESPPLPITPINLLPLTPPNDPSDSYLMQQLKKTTGKQFEAYLKRLFIHQDYKVELTKASGDKGADLIAKRAGERIVIQAKQRKENIGVEAIQEVYAARKVYHGTRAIVITPGQFTKPALELAKKLGVECWDGKRLLQELYKHQFFYPPEQAQHPLHPLPSSFFFLKIVKGHWEYTSKNY